jgi:ABC-type polysaccharide/polyol phosphate export permease
VLIYFQLNPMATLIDQARKILLLQQNPDWIALGWIALVSGLLIVLGSYLLVRFDRDYPNMLLT